MNSFFKRIESSQSFINFTILSIEITFKYRSRKFSQIKTEKVGLNQGWKYCKIFARPRPGPAQTKKAGRGPARPGPAQN